VTRRERARYTLDALREVIPRPETELEYTNPYELIVAVILSAQCTDARVNKVTPDLLKAFPTAESLAAATPDQVFPYIRSVSYGNSKARYLVAMAQMVLGEFGGKIPDTFEDLVKLPGVGRKTAQVVLSVAFDKAAFPVDTHVFRVANRIGLTKNADTTLKVEQQLKEIISESKWSEAHHLLILHGRYTCTARNPKHEQCPVAPVCLYYQRQERLPETIKGLDASLGKYYCKTRGHYFETPVLRKDRQGMEQMACPRCGSMNLFETRTGRSVKRVPDFRVS
jgi:endonuclease III